MEQDLGHPLALGRTAEIYAWRDGQVLKLFHEWVEEEVIEREGRISKAVHAAGLPVPAPGATIRINGRVGLVYERVEGVTMWEKLRRGPWQIPRYARKLAELHVALHQSRVDVELPTQRERLHRKIDAAIAVSGALRGRLGRALDEMPDGNRLCHGDFHPDNVLVTRGGMVIIDWVDATRGNPSADVARSSTILLGVAQVRSTLPWMKAAVRIFHEIYLRRYFALCPAQEAEFRRWLAIVAAARLSEGIAELEAWLLKRAST